MRGHLGTELGNKVSDTLVSRKKKEESGRVIFTVSQQDARGKDMEDWKFEVTDAAGALGIPQIIDNFDAPKMEDKKKAVDTERLKEWVKEACDTLTWPMSRSEFKKKVIGQIGGINNNDRQQEYLNAAFKERYIEETAMRKKGNYMIIPSQDLQEEMPF
jgi:5-methylcytosine-specific restriction endonuclease McrBC GTP-binding regulatory subunit McrB